MKKSIMVHVYRALFLLLLMLLFIDKWVHDPDFIKKIATILVRVENFGPWAFAIILVFFIAMNIFKRTVSIIWGFILKYGISGGRLWASAFWAMIVFFLLKYSAPVLREYANYVDYSLFNPVLLAQDEQITDEQFLQILLHKEFSNVKDTEKHKKIQESTQKLADSLGMKRVDLEFACYTEDVGDPFVISKVVPTRATGKCQLTSTGIGTYVRYKGKVLNMEDIRFAARTQDVDLLNSAMEQYAMKAWKSAGRPKMTSALHFKMLLFAPAYMHKMESGENFVIYSKNSSKPSDYFQNEPLDGWCIEAGRIVRNPLKKNGSIEISEVYYSMEYTKGSLKKEYTKK